MHTWNSSPLRTNVLRLQCTCCTVPTTSERPHGSTLVWVCHWPSSQHLSSPQLSHNDSLWAYGITKSHREQGLDYREAEELSWYTSRSNSLWQWWSYGLVYCPGENATDPIWRVLASSDGMSSWIPLKPQHSNRNPNPNPFANQHSDPNPYSLANQLWCINFLTPPTPLIIPHRLPAFLESLIPLKTDARFMQDSRKAVWSVPYVSVAFFPSLKQNFIAYRSSKVSSHPDCIFKIHQLWQSGFRRCILIAAVAVHLDLKS